jgi:hypothetical protein
MDVLASYIKWFENEPSAFPNNMDIQPLNKNYEC